MVEWSLDALRASASVRSIVVAAPPGHVDELAGSDLEVVSGGETRAESVALALAAVGTGLVAIHDAARPLVTPELVEALLAALDADPAAAGVIAAVPVADTIKRAATTSRGSPSTDVVPQEPPVVAQTVDRAGLWAAQTPQVFRTDALRAALAVGASRRDAATDEAMLLEAAGEAVLIIPGSSQNLKVTTPADLRLAELLLRERG